MSVAMTDYNFNFFCLIHVFWNNKSEVGNIRILAPSTVRENLCLSCKDKRIIRVSQIETSLPHFPINFTLCFNSQCNTIFTLSEIVANFKIKEKRLNFFCKKMYQIRFAASKIVSAFERISRLCDFFDKVCVDLSFSV